MAKHTGDEKAKGKGLWLYPSEDRALKDLAKRWKLKESRVVARLIKEANPDATGDADTSASVSAIVTCLARVEARLAHLEEILADYQVLPGEAMPGQREGQNAEVEAEGQAPAEVTPLEDDNAEDQEHPPAQEFARLKKLVVEAFERTGIGPWGPFVSGQRQGPELKRVLDAIGAMSEDGYVQFTGQRVRASSVLRFCLLYALTFEMDDDQGKARDQMAALGFSLEQGEPSDDLQRSVSEQLGTN